MSDLVEAVIIAAANRADEDVRVLRRDQRAALVLFWRWRMGRPWNPAARGLA